MKIIISHDIDHITASEHYMKDLIVPKHLLRSKIELFTGKISFSEVLNRYIELFRNKWNNLERLQEFNNDLGVPNTYFIGVKNGLGLSYSTLLAATTALELLRNNNKVYLHGINYQSLDCIKEEKSIFERVTCTKAAGIRMHYVRTDQNTLKNIAAAGYLFDSTTSEFINPYKVDEMWEFPFQIMDGWVIEAGKRRQSRNLNESKEETKRIIEKAEKLNLEFLGIDFHDRYFSKSFKTWMGWYTWLVEYLKKSGYTFTDFENSIQELNNRSLIAN